MAEKRVSVRLAAIGGKQVRAELEGVGDAGARGFGRMSREAELANAKLSAFATRVKIAAGVALAAAVAAGVAMVKSGLETIDTQANLAQSLGTTTRSIQVLAFAGDLAGVSMEEIAAASKKLTLKLSEAAGGTGTAVDALQRLHLGAGLGRRVLQQRADRHHHVAGLCGRVIADVGREIAILDVGASRVLVAAPRGDQFDLILLAGLLDGRGDAHVHVVPHADVAAEVGVRLKHSGGDRLCLAGIPIGGLVRDDLDIAIRCRDCRLDCLDAVLRGRVGQNPLHHGHLAVSTVALATQGNG